jgi:hypothetical protein
MVVTLKNRAGTTDTFDTSTTINAQAKQHTSNQPAQIKKIVSILLTICSLLVSLLRYPDDQQA